MNRRSPRCADLCQWDQTWPARRSRGEKHGIECGFVTGDTPTAERDALLSQFKRGELKYLCNVNVLTTGFDVPNIDCVALVRPTMSVGLY